MATIQKQQEAAGKSVRPRKTNERKHFGRHRKSRMRNDERKLLVLQNLSRRRRFCSVSTRRPSFARLIRLGNSRKGTSESSVQSRWGEEGLEEECERQCEGPGRIWCIAGRHAHPLASSSSSHRWLVVNSMEGWKTNRMIPVLFLIPSMTLLTDDTHESHARPLSTKLERRSNQLIAFKFFHSVPR